MEWHGPAIVLGSARHGETHTVTRVFTRERGAASGLVHGGQGMRKGPVLQPGNEVEAQWRGRTDEALGALTLELVVAHAANAFADRRAVLGLTAVTELLAAVLPEGSAYAPLYDATVALFGHLDEPEIFSVLLAKWELGLLSSLGFGLSLDRCTVTGATLEDGADLVFVSPRSGRAVTTEAGMPYRDKLLPLPPFLIDRGEPTRGDVAAALRLTGHFLGEKLLAPAGLMLPNARERLMQRLTRDADR